ncbi:MAG: hypothetical protein A2V66_01845 [Ignavibacteria bacterium RBG_13_36_8]|nr:MAG: hypothetical protein A2V66_01845 [Ignavibacteria bacterium RBG_13_36_8]
METIKISRIQNKKLTWFEKLRGGKMKNKSDTNTDLKIIQSRYATALEVFADFHESTGRGMFPNDFTVWCEQQKRLHAKERHDA